MEINFIGISFYSESLEVKYEGKWAQDKTWNLIGVTKYQIEVLYFFLFWIIRLDKKKIFIFKKFKKFFCFLGKYLLRWKKWFRIFWSQMSIFYQIHQSKCLLFEKHLNSLFGKFSWKWFFLRKIKKKTTKCFFQVLKKNFLTLRNHEFWNKSESLSKLKSVFHYH